MLRKWGTIVLLLLAAPILAQAQNTGRVSGVVTDASTGEPLPGANVFIEDTFLGGATNVNGEYTIYEVPPGVHTLRASFIGYVTEVRSNVEIIAGITTLQNFRLQVSTGEFDEIQVVAERPLVNPTATSAVRRLSREEFVGLPTRSVTTYFSIQPGVTFLNNNVYIRGGRPDETNYLLEGMSARSLVGADNVIGVIPEALEEIQVFAGGYSAELGRANAGIVQQVLRTGGPTLSASVQYETDQASDGLGAESYSYNDVTVTLGGPLLSTRHRFFGALNYQDTDNYLPTFWYGADLGTPVDDILGDSPEQPLQWSDGRLPGIGRPLEVLRANGTLLFDFHPLRIRLGGSHLSGNRRINDVPIATVYNQERLPRRDDSRSLGSLQATYFLSGTTYLQGNAGFFRYDFEQYDPLFSKPVADGQGGAVLQVTDYFSRDALREVLGGTTELADEYTRHWRGAYTPPAPYIFNGFDFHRPGQPASTYFRREQSYINSALSLQSHQGNHTVAVGGDYQRWTLREYSMSGGILASRIQNDPAFIDRIRAEQTDVAEIIRRGSQGGIGYDEFMNKIDDGPDGPKHPVTASLYVNDRMEFNDIVVNAGLRWDYFDMDLWTVDDPARPNLNRGEWSVEDLRKAPSSSVLQPRLGLSFPVTERTVFHLQYGKFAQMPDMFFAYTRRSRLATALSGQFFIAHPFAFELDPIRTTQYEIGFGHQFTEQAAFDITAFYRKTEGQIEIVRQRTAADASASDYNVFRNGDFAIARGIEISLRTRRVGNFMGLVNYTFTDAKGTNSEPGGQVSSLENQTAPPSIIQPLSFEQRHRGAFVIDFRTGQTANPLVQNWTVNLLLTYNSGHRFTHATGGMGQRGAGEGALLDGTDTRNRIPIEPLNASVTPWYFNTDVRVEKGFTTGRATGTVYMYVQNLFDSKNVINVYNRTGNADDDGFLSNPTLSQQLVEGRGEDYVRFYNAINLLNRQHYITDTGNDLFATPRQIRLGIRVEI